MSKMKEAPNRTTERPNKMQDHGGLVLANGREQITTQPNSVSSTMNDREQWKCLIESEHHYDMIQAGIRGLASTWILAALGAIAYSIGRLDAPIATRIAPVPFICMVACLGFLVLWIMDQRVYQHLLNAEFLCGLELERRYEALPAVHWFKLLADCGQKTIPKKLGRFYLVPILILLALSTLASVLIVRQDFGPPINGDAFVRVDSIAAPVQVAKKRQDVATPNVNYASESQLASEQKDKLAKMNLVVAWLLCGCTVIQSLVLVHIFCRRKVVSIEMESDMLPTCPLQTEIQRFTQGDTTRADENPLGRFLRDESQ